MFLHIGDEVEISFKDIVAIIDIEKTAGKITDEFIKKFKDKGFVINVSEEPVKSMVVVKNKDGCFLYMSPLSTATLNKRFIFFRKY